ncbi:hypothetical protein [Thioalkalivibrio sp. XN279]|uniref:hypothetical protein n=1 Tax=Thioalkalivibrio sp. XN279 TaxID=2714953 RepID=UPI001409334F|nr:hypothetical protein [Thioalkalivibrio sp. XN279]NHA14018.1 hypothetical protein [Thioalkalivibrio sp. XN279]
MSVEKWRDWMELIALIAVVASLIALVVELRQTQVALRAQAYQARAFDGIAWNMEFAKDASIRDMQDRFYEPDFDPDSLSPSELSIARRLITIVRIDLDNEHYQFQSGFLDESFYQGETVPRIRSNAPLWRAMGIVSPRQEFRAEVDRILGVNRE